MTDRPDPRDIEALLTGAFGSRHHAVATRPSLADVRRRARRRQRRTVGGITAAAAVVGVGGVAALATRSPGTSGATGAPDDSVACLPGPTSVVAPEQTVSTSTSVYLEPGASTSLFPQIVTSTTIVEPLTDSMGAPVVVDTTSFTSPAPCGPPPTSPNPAEPTTTYVGRGQVLVVDASGVEGAVDEVSELLARINPYVDVTVVTGTRTVDETMVMPTSNDQALIDEVAAAVGIGGFDTWTASLAPADTPLDGVAVVVVIGADWSDRKS